MDALEVHPRAGVRLALALVGAAMLLGGAVLAAVLAGPDRPLWPATVVMGLGVGAFGAGVSTRGVRLVSVAGGVLRLHERDGTVLSLPLDQVGGLGHRGVVLAGQLVSLIGGWQRRSGRVVVLDRYGRTMAARTAGGVALEDLEDMVGRCGLAWAGPVAASAPVVDPPPPSWEGVVPPPPSVPAVDDPVTADALQAMSSARRRRLAAYAGLVVVGIVAGMLTGAVPHGSAVSVVLGWTCGLGITLGVILLLVAPLNEDRPSKVRRSLRNVRWELVELVVLDGRGGDQSARAVGVCVPGSPFLGVPESWWKVAGGGRGGWLLGDVRRWGWIARDPDGSHAVVAPLDRSRFARLSCTRADRGACAAASRSYLTDHELTHAPLPPPAPAPWPAPAPDDAVWLAPQQ